MPESLATYLKDHFAGASGGGELCRRIADSAASDEEAKDVNSIAAEIDDERTILKQMMGRLEVSPSIVKAAGGWVGEKAGRVKLRASDEAGRVLQYEAMIMGVTGKLNLWRSLLVIEPRVPELDRPELEKLARQAEEQRSRLERWHDTAAKNLA